METKDHLTLARLITASNENFDRSSKKIAFETGCISPDINVVTYINGHTYSGTINYVRKTLTKLSGKLHKASDFFELGRAMHFVADYFTFPHSPNFKGTLKEHVDYESVLHKYIENNLTVDYPDERFRSICGKKTTAFVDAAHTKYLGLKNSVKTDWDYIRFVCSEVTYALTCQNVVVVPKRIRKKAFASAAF